MIHLYIYSCRPTDYPYWYGMLVPFGIIYLFNWTMFVIIMIMMLKRTHVNAKYSEKEMSIIAQGKRLTLTAGGLSIVFGLGWGVGIATLLSSTIDLDEVHFAFQVIFSILVGFHGLLMFLFYGICQKEVREVWKSWLIELPCIRHQNVWHTASSRRQSVLNIRTHRSSLIEGSSLKYELDGGTFGLQTKVALDSIPEKKELESPGSMDGQESVFFNPLANENADEEYQESTHF